MDDIFDFIHAIWIAIITAVKDIFGFVVFGVIAESVLKQERLVLQGQRLDAERKLALEREKLDAEGDEAEMRISRELFKEHEAWFNKWFRAVRAGDVSMFSLEEKKTIYKMLTRKFGIARGRHLYRFGVASGANGMWEERVIK